MDLYFQIDMAVRKKHLNLSLRMVKYRLIIFLRCYENFFYFCKTFKKKKSMCRKRKGRPSVDSLFTTVSNMLVPEHILKDFDIYGAKEYPTRWVIEMREKEDRIPVALRESSDVVFDGYCNPIETLSHSFVCKPIYLRIYRRRYKRSNEDCHFSNNYDFTLKGVKMVPELGLFLKTED
jgi:hypothetical protein